MRNLCLTLFCCLFLLSPLSVRCQNSGKLTFRHCSIDSLSLKLDSLSVVPGSFRIVSPQNVDFSLNPVTAVVTLFDSSLLHKTLVVEYQTFNTDFSKYYFHKPRPDFEPSRFSHDFPDYVLSPVDEIFNDDNLFTNGSITRGITVGSNQDFALNSSLNLQISGKLSDDVEITAAITDKNIPIQPEGNTFMLQDVNSIFIALKIKDLAIVKAGDVATSFSNYDFLKASRNMLGLLGTVNSEYRNSKFKNSVGGGVAKGKFSRLTLNVQTGVQGPYKLYGSDNELSIIVIAGSERVYIDGEQLVRGQENDYVIDYNTAELSFTPNILISSEKRVIVEFEYSDRHYSRYNLFTDNEFHFSWKHPLTLHVGFFQEQDLKYRSLQPELSDSQMLLLSQSGNVNSVPFSSFDTVAYSQNRVLYEKIDTVYLNNIYTIFLYSNNSDNSLYAPTFSYVGANQGNYILSGNSANGRVFVWIAPENGVPQGDYEPIVLLTAPSLHQMFNFGLDFNIRENTMLNASFALSNYDKNTFSKNNASSNVGCSYSLKFNDIEKFNSKNDTIPWILDFSVETQFVGKNFTPFESFRDVEFARNFNLLTDYSADFSDFYVKSMLKAVKKSKHDLRYSLIWFDRLHDVNIFRNELSTDNKWNSWSLKSTVSYLFSSDSIQKSRFSTAKLHFSKSFNALNLSFFDNFEHNMFFDKISDSLRQNSYSFNEASINALFFDDKSHKLSLFYKNRVEFLPISANLKLNTLINEIKTQYKFSNIKNQNLSFSAIYRNQIFADTSMNKFSEHYFVGNFSYSARFFRNSLILNTYYETGSGMEQKKSFTFIKVAAGQGTHTWKDYNANGIEEIDEFEVAAFADEAEYIKVWIPGTDYVNVFNSIFTQSFILRPAAVWSQKSGILKFLSRFSNSLNLRTALKHNSKMFVPLVFATDSNLVSNNLSLANTFSFNNSASKFAFDFNTQITDNKQFLYYGYEQIHVDFYELILKSRSADWLYLQFAFHYKETDNSSSFERRNFHVEAFSCRGELRLEFDNKHVATLSGEFFPRKNVLGDEKIKGKNVEISYNYRLLNRGVLAISAKFVDISGNTGENSAVSYYIADGLTQGRNLLWNADVKITISKFLQLSIVYNGRAMQHHPIIHSGQVGVSAVF